MTVCGASVLQIGLPLSEATAADGPNFVTIMVDDMGFSDIGAFGATRIDTPNMDALAGEGVILSQFYSAPTSTPARAMFFTGKDNHEAGIGAMAGYTASHPILHDRPNYVGKLLPEVMTFPEVLQANGYHTMMTGKWDLGEAPGERAHDRGFTETLVLLPGGDVHYISDADGKLITSQPPSYYTRLGQDTPYSRNGEAFSNFPPNAYSTEFYTDEAIKMLDAWAEGGKVKPFYLNLAHIAPHAPFQAPADLIEKYTERFADGWDVLRAERFERLKELGFVDAQDTLPPANIDVIPWDALSAEQQQIEVRRMAVYAGMMAQLDYDIGRLIDHLKAIGEYDNTVLFIFSDNGAAAIEAGAPAKQNFVNANFTSDTIADLDNMGAADSFISAVEGLGQLSNTPFLRYKAETFEGGMHTAAFVHYPQMEDANGGGRYDCITSVMDIGATILDMAGIPYPTVHPTTGAANPPMDGVSMSHVFAGQLSCPDPDRYIAFEQDSAKMLRRGDWKLAQQWDVLRNRWDEHVYLFNLQADPFEEQDLAATEPEQFAALWGLYEDYAAEHQVVDLGPRAYDPNGNRMAIGASLGQDETFTPLAGGMITGGVQVNYASLFHPPTGTAKIGDIVDIHARMYLPAAHIGQAGDTIAVAFFVPDAPGEAPRWLSYQHGADQPVPSEDYVGYGVESWANNTDLNALPSFTAYTGEQGLPGRVQMPIYEGIVGGSPGTYRFWVGYRTEDGTVVNSTRPITLVVTAE